MISQFCLQRKNFKYLIPLIIGNMYKRYFYINWYFNKLKISNANIVGVECIVSSSSGHFKGHVKFELNENLFKYYLLYIFWRYQFMRIS